VDGDFGPATESALKKFQKVTNLEADAICGPLTWVALG
jgi:peptidoglycan hydrolase-like protein with peptidoglycan-binding domain